MAVDGFTEFFFHFVPSFFWGLAEFRRLIYRTGIAFVGQKKTNNQRNDHKNISFGSSDRWARSDKNKQKKKEERRRKRRRRRRTKKNEPRVLPRFRKGTRRAASSFLARFERRKTSFIAPISLSLSLSLSLPPKRKKITKQGKTNLFLPPISFRDIESNRQQQQQQQQQRTDRLSAFLWRSAFVFVCVCVRVGSFSFRDGKKFAA